MLRMTDSGSVLLFSDKVSRELEEYFGVGRFDYPENRVEQAMVLVGEDIVNDGRVVKSVVKYLIPIHLEEATPGFLKWSGKETILMNRQVQRLKELEPNLRILGWVHSHPNGLPVFLSEIDRGNIRRIFNRTDHFHVVLNPQSCCWKCWIGPEPAEVLAMMYADVLLGKTEAPSEEAPEEEEDPPKEVLPPPKKAKKNKNYGKSRHHKKKRR